MAAAQRDFIQAHQGGKLRAQPAYPIATPEDLAIIYAPGAADVSEVIREDRDTVYSLATKGNSVAIVADGSSVLGLGDTGREAALSCA